MATGRRVAHNERMHRKASHEIDATLLKSSKRIEGLRSRLDNLGPMLRKPNTSAIRDAVDELEIVRAKMRTYGEYDAYAYRAMRNGLAPRLSVALKNGDRAGHMRQVEAEMGELHERALGRLSKRGVKGLAKLERRVNALDLLTKYMDGHGIISSRLAAAIGPMVENQLGKVASGRIAADMGADGLLSVERSMRDLTYARAGLGFINSVTDASRSSTHGGISMALRLVGAYPDEWYRGKMTQREVEGEIIVVDGQRIASIINASSMYLRELMESYVLDKDACLDRFGGNLGMLIKEINERNMVMFAKAHLYLSNQPQGTVNEINGILSETNALMGSFVSHLNSTDGTMLAATAVDFSSMNAQSQSIFSALESSPDAYGFRLALQEQAVAILKGIFESASIPEAFNTLLEEIIYEKRLLSLSRRHWTVGDLSGHAGAVLPLAITGPDPALLTPPTVAMNGQ